MSDSGENQDNVEAEKVIEAVYSYAAELMKANNSDQHIIEALMEKGISESVSEVIVRNLRNARKEVLRKAGMKNIVIGLLWCVGGIVITAFTYSLASEGGGRYIITWGAILFGGIQAARGLFQYFSE